MASSITTTPMVVTTCGVKSVAPWTLNDFVQGGIPSSAVSRIPAQYNYGLYRVDGSAKPAAAVVKAGWTDASLASYREKMTGPNTNGMPMTSMPASLGDKANR